MCHRFLIICRNSPSVITSGATHNYQERGKQYAIKRAHMSARNLCPFYHQVSLLKPLGKAPEAQGVTRVWRVQFLVELFHYGQARERRVPPTRVTLWLRSEYWITLISRNEIHDVRRPAMARSDLSGMRPITFAPRAYL